MKKIAIAATSLALVGASLCGANVFADNPYGIEYSGGVPLETVVQVNPSLINSLSPLLHGDGTNVILMDSAQWQNGYIKDMGQCHPAYYFTTSRTAPEPKALLSDSAIADHDFIFYNDSYAAVVGINNVSLVERTSSDIVDTLNATQDIRANESTSFAAGVPTARGVAVGVIPGYNLIYGGWQIYSDSSCTQPIAEASSLIGSEDYDLYIDMNIKLYQNNDEHDEVISDNLYFEITDIDAGQSYKILNPDNEFAPNNMFVASATALQNPDSDSLLHNMYSELGQYIYSDIDYSGNGFNIDNTSNLYTKLAQSTQEEGLNIVFGYTAGAASGIGYYEQIEEEPEEEADDSLAVPNTGVITGSINAMLVPASIIGILFGTLVIRIAIRLCHRRVNFD